MYCDSYFDTIMCWPPSPVGLNSRPCPEELNGVSYDTSGMLCISVFILSSRKLSSVYNIRVQRSNYGYVSYAMTQYYQLRYCSPLQSGRDCTPFRHETQTSRSQFHQACKHKKKIAKHIKAFLNEMGYHPKFPLS